MAKRSWTDEQLEEAIRASRSWAQVIRALNLKAGGGTYAHLQKVAEEQGFSSEHFTGQGWNVGQDFRQFSTNRRPIEAYLETNGVPIGSDRLRRRLLSEGLKDHVCEICRRTQWMSQAIPLELDHINGDNKDNRIDNLRLLCPNCHAQTDTYCGKNISK
jgi:hypothetical protein